MIPRNESDSREAAKDTGGRGLLAETGQSKTGRRTASVLYLNRFYLASLALLFAGMITALEVLNQFSERHQGLVAAVEDQHYLWTYGPTLILTIVAAIWGQIEYHVVQLMPWLILRRKPTAHGIGGLLVDYLTPFSIVSLFRSVANKHFPVALGILGSAVLKGLIIVSTGLIALETQELSQPTNFTTMNQFNLSRVMSTASVVYSGVTIWSIKSQNMSFPPGTTSAVATQIFKLPDSDMRLPLLVSANISVFGAAANCQTFSWELDTAFIENDSNTIQDYLPREFIDQVAPYCIVGYDGTVDIEFGTFIDAGINRIETMRVLDLCPNELALADGDTHRLFFPFRYDLSADKTGVSALLCRPTYSITQRQVTASGAGTSLSQDGLVVSQSILSSSSLGVQPLQVTTEIFASIGPALMDAVGAGSRDEYNQDEWYGIMNLTFPRGSLQVYRDAGYFRDAFESGFKSTAAQTINTRGMAPSNVTIPGTIVYASPRLVVIDVSLRLMQGLLGVLILACVGLCLYDFSGLPKNPGALIAPASVLSRSDELQGLLGGSGSGSLDDLHRILCSHRFESTTDSPAGALMIDVETGVATTQTETEISKGYKNRSEWWLPMPASMAYKIGLICFTVGLIAALESLLQLSQSHDGIMALSVEGYSKYGWLLLPTFLIACISLAFAAIDTSAKILHPYQELRRRRPNNTDAMLFDPLGQVTLQAIPHSVRRRYWSLSAAMFLSVLGPLLTIAASGLFTAQFIPSAQSVDLPLSGWFDLRNATTPDGIALINSDSSTRAPTKDSIFNMAIQFQNLSFPKGTYDEFAFAEIDINSLLPLLGKVNMSSTTLQARLPAVRGELNCTAWPVGASADGKRSLNKPLPMPMVPTFVPVAIPPGCTYDTPSNNTVLGLLRQGGRDSPRTGFFGYWADTEWAPPNGTDISGLRDPFSICNDARQHLFFFYGHNNNSKSMERLLYTADQLDVLHCMPFLEAMYVDATLMLPNLAIDLAAPSPSPVPGSVMMWDANNASANTLPYPGFPGPGVVNLDSRLPGIFAALVQGYQGRPADEIIGGRNTTQMIDGLNHLFRQMVAQSLHFNYRTSLSTSGSSTRRRADTAGAFGTTSRLVDEPAAAVLLDGAQRRLVQSAISTRLLEALLAVLVLCTILVCALGGGARVVPKNPGSLGARMSLFADSDVLGRIIEYEMGMKKMPLLRAGESFALGWWYRSDSELSVGSQQDRHYGVDIWSSSGSALYSPVEMVAVSDSRTS